MLHHAKVKNMIPDFCQTKNTGLLLSTSIRGMLSSGAGPLEILAQMPVMQCHPVFVLCVLDSLPQLQAGWRPCWGARTLKPTSRS